MSVSKYACTIMINCLNVSYDTPTVPSTVPVTVLHALSKIADDNNNIIIKSRIIVK